MGISAHQKQNAVHRTRFAARVINVVGVNADEFHAAFFEKQRRVFGEEGMVRQSRRPCANAGPSCVCTSTALFSKSRPSNASRVIAIASQRTTTLSSPASDVNGSSDRSLPSAYR